MSGEIVIHEPGFHPEPPEGSLCTVPGCDRIATRINRTRCKAHYERDHARPWLDPNRPSALDRRPDGVFDAMQEHRLTRDDVARILATTPVEDMDRVLQKTLRRHG